MSAAMRVAVLLLLLLLAPAMARAERAAIDALRSGDAVVFLRHAETGDPWPDHAGAVMGDCASQRALTDAGRAQAEAIGEAFRALAIPATRILASPFCRAMETAVLAFGIAMPEPALGLPRHLDAAAHAAMGAALRDLVAEAARTGGTTILVGHSYHLIAAGGPRPDPQGAAAVLRPRADGSFETLALIPPGGWSRLAAPRTAEAR